MGGRNRLRTHVIRKSPFIYSSQLFILDIVTSETRAIRLLLLTI